MPTLPRFPVLATAILYAAIALICTQIPLLQTLGYEFSALMALVSSAVAGIATARWISRNAVGDLWRSTGRLFRRALAVHLALLIIPLIIMAGNALVVRNCSFPDGLVFFLLLPAVSVWFAVSFATFCAVHYRHPRLVFTGGMFLSFLYGAALGYWTPAVYAYNVFFGYFPGLTYDEALRPDVTLVLFRLFTAGLGLVFLRMALLLVSQAAPDMPAANKGMVLLRALVAPPRIVRTGAVAVVLLAVYLFRGQLGFESPAGYIRDQLGGMYETPHFLIYYRAGSMTAEELHFVGAEHEFRLRQIMRVFSMPSHPTIISYLYPSADVKKRLMGAGGTNIAKPWSGEIHIHRQALAASLKHELVHVVAAPFGVPVFRTALRPALIEGLAMAVEGEWGDRTLHRYAAAMKRCGISTDVTALMQYGGFASRGPSVGYVLAGSFCRFLIDTYGMRPMTLLYRSGDFVRVYGREPAELGAAWGRFLDGVAPVPAESSMVDALFRRPPIFGKVCARVAAARNREAAGVFSAGDPAAAARLYGETYAETHGIEALGGFVRSATAAHRFDAVLAVLDTVVGRSDRPGIYLPLSLQFGLSAWGAGDTARAASLFTQLINADVADAWTEAALLCRHALAEPDNRPALLAYCLSPSPDSLRLAALDSMVQDAGLHWIPLYYRGRAAVQTGKWERGLATLERIDLGAVDSRLEAHRHEMIGVCLLRLGFPQEARSAFWTSMNHRSDEMWRIRMEDWIELCEVFGDENG
jgi:hypothetical protein